MAGTATTAATAALSQSINAMGNASSAQALAALKVKSKAAAQQFEAMFLNTMFQHMFSGLKGEGPFGGSGAQKVWRSMLTDEYAKNFAKTGGIGIASHVYAALLRQQGVHGK